jgi:hypothetical protein
LVQAALEEGVTVEGSVRSADDGRPIPGAKITVHSAPVLKPGAVQMREGWFRKEAVTDENGNFMIPGLPEGEISLNCSHPDYFWEKGESLFFTIFTVPSQEPPDLAIRLSRAGKLRGKIEGLPPFKMGEDWYSITLVRLVSGKSAQAKAGGIDGPRTPVETSGRPAPAPPEPARKPQQTTAGEPVQARTPEREVSEINLGGNFLVNPQGAFEIASLRPGTYRLGLMGVKTDLTSHEHGTGVEAILGEVVVTAGETADFKASVR